MKRQSQDIQWTDRQRERPITYLFGWYAAIKQGGGVLGHPEGNIFWATLYRPPCIWSFT